MHLARTRTRSRAGSRAWRAAVITIIGAVAACGVGASNAVAAEPGALDARFSPLARHVGPDSGNETATGVALRHDGRIVVAVANDSDLDRRIVGLLANGQLDTSFSQDGIWHLDQPGNTTVVRGVATLADGKVVFVGDDGSQQAIVVGRLMKDGELDPTFGGGDGLYVHPTGTGTSPYLEQVRVEADGGILFAGSVTTATRGREVLVGRLTAGGADDPAFTGAPYATFGAALDAVDDRFAGLVRMPNGELILGLSHDTGTSGVVRIGATANYAVVRELDLGPGMDRLVDLVAVDSTRVAAIATADGGVTALSRIDVADTPKPDPTFDGDGVATPFAATFHGVQLLREAGGRFLVAGFDTVGDGRRAVARVDAGGALDTSFGSGGIALLAGGAVESSLLRAHELALDPDGSIVSASHVGAPVKTKTAVDRLVGRIARVRVQVLGPAATPRPGALTRVTMRVTNDGPDAAGATTLDFLATDGLVVESSAGPCTYSSATSGRCLLPDVPPGTSRDVTLDVRSAAAGGRSIGAHVDSATFDDAAGDDDATLLLTFAAPSSASAAPSASKAPGTGAVALRAPVLTLRRLVRSGGRALRCGASARMACATPRLRVRGRSTPMWLRAAARPLPGTARRRVDVVVQRREGRRFVTRGGGTLDLRANGTLDLQLPSDMRRERSMWRMRLSVRATPTSRAARSAWFYVRVG